MHRSHLSDRPAHLWLRLRLAAGQEEWKQDYSAAGEIREEDNLRIIWIIFEDNMDKK